ncbi:MAG: transporter substrate-binding protein [Glaciihabitans sp.]|nr:transporter substrate-binding protein [Glaciihabitans sp.]
MTKHFGPESWRRRRGTTLAATIAVVALAGGLAACSSPDDSNGDGESSDETIAVGVRLEPTNLDIVHTSGIALDQVLIDNVYEGLLTRTDDGGVADLLAENHSVSGDGLTYTFDIRDDVTFHDGAALTVDDVVWSLNRVKDDSTVSANPEFASVDTVSADGNTVTIALSEPNSSLLWSLAGRAGLVLEEAATNDLETSANGTGPFTLDEWKQGDSITLDRNDGYWGDEAAVGGVVFQYFTDPSAEVNAVLAGELDAATGIDASLVSQLDGNEDYDVIDGTTTDKFTLAFNNAKAPLNDIRVRQAIRQAIDNDALIAAVDGAGYNLSGPIPEGDPGYEDLTDVDPYNPGNAETLLAEAGVNDLSLSLTIPSFYGTALTDVLTTELADVGIALTVNQVEFPTWLEDVYTNHDFDLSVVNHAESRDFANWANPDYYFGYNNPEVQSLYAESQLALTPEDATAKLRQAAELVANDAPAEWLLVSISKSAVATSITGFPTDFTSSRLNLTHLAVS